MCQIPLLQMEINITMYGNLFLRKDSIRKPIMQLFITVGVKSFGKAMIRLLDGMALTD